MEDKVFDRVQVNLADKEYEIVIGSGLLENAGALIRPVILSDRVIIITDKNVSKVHLELLQSALDDEGLSHETVIISGGEKTKSFSGLEELLDSILDLNPDRKTTLIALGGGVVGDITGFAASILLRGIRFIQIPTTLLAMVDSSVGGKTGINTKHGKNLVGTFHQPSLVIADVELLNTLPEREWLAGYAEVVKYGLIGDKELFETLEKATAVALSLRGSDNEEEKEAYNQFCSVIVAKSCEAKARIVSEDEKESGKRALLNLGHTFGHSLEAEMGYNGTLLHGEAVSIGMVMAFQFSNALGICDVKDVERVANHLSEIGMPVTIDEIKKELKVDNLIEHISHDKKTRNGKPVLVMTKGIGHAFIKDDIDKEDLHEFLYQVVAHKNQGLN